jgi:hypothetical protein
MPQIDRITSPHLRIGSSPAAMGSPHHLKSMLDLDGRYKIFSQ